MDELSDNFLSCSSQLKIYPSVQAMEELAKMNLSALYKSKSIAAIDLQLVSVNIHSLSKHVEDLIMNQK